MPEKLDAMTPRYMLDVGSKREKREEEEAKEEEEEEGGGNTSLRLFACVF